MKESIMLRAAIIASLLTVTGCMRAEMRRVSEMKINDVSIASIPDGTYTGSHTFGGFTYSVRATVIEGRVEKVRVLHNRDTRRAEKAESVVRRVVAKQNVDIDAVSGATATSKALLKACERALSKGASQSNE
jgi:uncharacterized protein with FMN-binding domain